MRNQRISAGRRRAVRRMERPRDDDRHRPPSQYTDSRADQHADGAAPSGRGLPEEQFVGGIDALLAELEARLRAAGSPLVSHAQIWEHWRRKAHTILAECAVELCGDERRVPPAGRLSQPDDCTLLAAHDIELAELLRAFELLTELAVRLLAHCVAGALDGPARMSTAVRCLNRAVAARTREAVRSYGLLSEVRVEQARAGSRRRLAREVHDHVGNGLSLAHRHLEMYDVLHGRDRPAAHHKVGQASRVLADTLGNLRQLVSDLRLEQQDVQLVEALERFAEAMAPAGTEVDIRLEGDERWIPDTTAGELFTVAREMLRNAFAHARASRLTVRIAVRPDEARISVRDDGAGFDTGARHDGHGLTSMAERADALGGEFDLWSWPGVGTRALVWVPLAEVRSERTG